MQGREFGNLRSRSENAATPSVVSRINGKGRPVSSALPDGAYSAGSTRGRSVFEDAEDGVHADAEEC